MRFLKTTSAVVLSLVLVAGVAWAAATAQQINGETFTASVDANTGAVTFSVTGNSSIGKVSRLTGSAYKDITDFDSRKNEPKEWRCQDTLIQNNEQAHSHYRVRVTIKGKKYDVDVTAKGDGSVTIDKVTAVP